MLRIFASLCFLFYGFTIAASPKYIFHFDINRTIIALDSHQDYNFDDLINLTLAKNIEDYWDENCTQPMNYYDYVYKILYQGPQSDSKLRKKRREKIHQFIFDLKKMNHPKDLELFEIYERVKEKLKEIENRPFPSFVKFLEYLRNKKIKYHLVFRTFGQDFNQLHPFLKQVIGETVPKAKFINRDLIHGDEKFSTVNGWLRLFTKYPYLLVQDDYHYWNRHQEHGAYGKPMPISDEVLCLFFDDNLSKNGSFDRSIVAPYDVKTSQILSGEDLTRSKILIPVNTLNAIIDENYYIQLFEYALDSYNTLDN